MSTMDDSDASGRATGADGPRSSTAAVEALLADAFADAPEFGGILEVAALPRSFDGNLLAGLLALPATDKSFQDAVRWLTDNPFVHERSDHSWALHDRVRGPLLLRWSQTRPDDLVGLLHRLETLYVRKYERTSTALESLAMTEAIIRKASDERYWVLAETLEDDLIRAALESVHTAIRISFEVGRWRLVNVINDLVRRAQYRSCEVVVRGWSANEEDVSDENRGALKAWGSYCMAQALWAGGRPQEALDILDTVPDPQAVGLLFATWYFHQRALVLRRLNRFEEALHDNDSEIAIHDEHHIDDLNVATPWLQKADLHQLLKRHELQTLAAEEALERATRLSTPSAQVMARASLTFAHSAAGNEQQTAREMVQAAKAARLSVTDEPNQQVQAANKVVLETAISAVGPGSPRLVAAWGEQLRQLTVGDGPGAEFDVFLLQAQALAEAGQSETSTKLYQRARRLVEERIPDRLTELDADEAGASELLGNPQRGAELNLRLIHQDTSNAGPWERARWLTNATTSLLACGEYSRALELIPRAVEGWTAIGVDHALCLTKAVEGELHRRTGNLAGAAIALGEAAAIMDRPVISAPSAYLSALCSDQADYASAADAACRAFAIAQKVDPRTVAAQQGLVAVRCLAEARRLDEAIAVQAEVGKILEAITQIRAWKPSEDSELADRHAGRALRILVSGFGPTAARARSAIEHLEIATAADDSVGWYQAELGWAFVLLGNDKLARKAFGTAVGNMPTPALQEAMKVVLDELS